MSAEDEFDSLFADADNNGIDTNSPGIKSLRKAYDKLKAEATQLRTQVGEAAKATRTSTLNAALENLGAKPALAKYFPQDTEVTADAVKSWLEEDGEIFGWKPTEATSDEDTEAIRAVGGLVPKAPDSSLHARTAALGQTRSLGRDITSVEAKEAASVADALLGQLGLTLR